MATILEVGAEGETWRSEHSGRQATAPIHSGRRPPTPDAPDGELAFSDAQKEIWEHENRDYADDREALQVGAERPVPRASTPAGPVSLSQEDWADLQELRSEMRSKKEAEERQAADREAESRRQFEEWRAKQAATDTGPAGGPAAADQAGGEGEGPGANSPA